MYDNYGYGIQRADAMRLFFLHKYGGVYIDLDIECQRSLDFLRHYAWVMPQARPRVPSPGTVLEPAGVLDSSPALGSISRMMQQLFLADMMLTLLLSHQAHTLLPTRHVLPGSNTIGR